MQKKLIGLVFLALLVLALPVVIFLARTRQDIRPRASQAKANMLLFAEATDVSVDGTNSVIVSTQVTDTNIRVSGVDFTLLYDKDKLDVDDVVPSNVFTDVQVKYWGGSFDQTYNFVRVAETVNKPHDQLPKDTFQLARITFKGKAEGDASVKFPDDNKFIEIVSAE